VGIPYTPDTLGVGARRAWVTIALVAANSVIYVLTSLDNGLVQIADRWLWWGAFIPAYLPNFKQSYRLITSMFLHANLLHIFFNMIYLYNFGRLVEQALGGKRYLALYLLSGLAAEVFHAAFVPIEGPLTLATPAIGASGAISGVLGAYLLLFPGSRLSMCFFFLYFPVCFTASAAAYLIFWFIMQVLQGYAQASMGVAVFAHAGGFVAGMALLPLILDRERHRLLRALTASQRAFKYVFLGSAGLGPLSKAILAAAILSLVAGGAYCIAAAPTLRSPIKVLGFSVAYSVYCPPTGDLCDQGFEEDAVVLALDGRPRLAAQITTTSVRIVYNRLEALGVIYDKAWGGTTRELNVKQTVRVMGVPVSVDVRMDATYDRSGVLDRAKGGMRTTILSCTARACTPSGEGDFDFEVRPILGTEGGTETALMVASLSAAAMALSLGALDAVLRKAGALEIIA